MLRIAIVEDEEIFARELEEYVRRYAAETFRDVSITHYSDGEEIAGNYRGGFDLLLMDIQMTFMDGMTAAEKIRERDPEVIIIFITNRNDYAVRGYEVDALDYVVKPLEYFSFSQKLDRAVQRLEKKTDRYIPVYADGGLYKVAVRQILFVESDRHNLHFHLTSGELVTRMNLSEAEEMLRYFGFFRCGKGFLINLDKVDSYSDGVCRIGGFNVPVSRSKKKEFMNMLADHMSSRLV